MSDKKPLDVKSLAALKPRATAYRFSDGGGLLLEVRPSGSKLWFCRLTLRGRRRDMGLGGFPLVSLATARAAAVEARRLAREGTDPIERRATLAAEQQAAEAARTEAGSRTFRAISEKCIDALSPGWKNRRTADLWRTSLIKYVHPTLGDLPVAAIDRNLVLQALDGVWTSRPATGRKVLRRIGTVLRFAAAHGWRANDNPADARMLRYSGLSALPGGRKQPSLPWAKAPAFLKALDAMPGLAPLALRFLILTTVRSGDVRGARWSELSFDGSVTWTIPGERLKRKKSSDVQTHRVPLSPAAIDCLIRVHKLTSGASATAKVLPKLAALRGKAFIFPSAKRDKPFSDMALSAVMRRMNESLPEGAPPPWRDADGRAGVPHGWRATFRTWVDDVRPEDGEAAERALAHEDTNKVSGAYRRSDLFERRRVLMSAWADHCTAPSAPSQGAKRRNAR